MEDDKRGYMVMFQVRIEEENHRWWKDMWLWIEHDQAEQGEIYQWQRWKKELLVREEGLLKEHNQRQLSLYDSVNSATRRQLGLFDAVNPEPHNQAKQPDTDQWQRHTDDAKDSKALRAQPHDNGVWTYLFGS